ncbi:AAA family ATPase [Actinokineospora sp. NPDC004072]
MTAEKRKMVTYADIARVFTPSAPVISRDSFAGRSEEIMSILDVLNDPGQQVALYGERGVGKTSLANVLSEFLTIHDGQTTLLAARINCNSNDNFKSIWVKVFRELSVPVPEQWAFGTPDPDEIRSLLSKVRPVRLVVLDEFDRVDDDEALSLMADTIKACSDHRVATKLVIVGVADSIDQLIGEHASVQRGLAEVHLARMSYLDSQGIITSGLDRLNLTIESAAQNRINRLAEGLPHYVHLLAKHACQLAVADDRSKVTIKDVELAIDKAMEKHSVVKEYQLAIQSPRKKNLYAHVLAACALAEKNLLGQFVPSSLRDPLYRMTGRSYTIQSYSKHLADFASDDKGNVLKREGSPRKYTFRFQNPLLQPFSVMAACRAGIIPDDYMSEIFRAPDTDEIPPLA